MSFSISGPNFESIEPGFWLLVMNEFSGLFFLLS